MGLGAGKASVGQLDAKLVALDQKLCHGCRLVLQGSRAVSDEPKPPLKRHDSTHEFRTATQVLMRGYDPKLSLGSARPAVFRSSTYVFETPEAAERAFSLMAGRARPAPGEDTPHIYARFNHPNAELVEDHLVPLEAGGAVAAVFNSGMAAIMTSILSVVNPGDSVLYTVPIYGGTQSLLTQFLEPFGITCVPVTGGDCAAWETAVRQTENLRVILIETPANPTLRMTDIAGTVACAKQRASSDGGAAPLVMVDNTFLGPVFQHPLTLGADLCVYSATKFLGGFSDLIAGAVIGRDAALMQAIKARRALFGNILPPDECWMLDGRLPTVVLRMTRASKNAQRIAETLHASKVAHKTIAKLYYPTLFTDPDQIRIRDQQCDFPGSLLSIDLKGGKQAAFEFLRHLRISRNAVSLGGVETLACHPKTTTHSAVPEDELQLAGITDGLVRVSIGIEDWRDLLADFEQALNKV
jgi:cystathionine beta-lyase/cystathionine gamma-synthase